MDWCWKKTLAHIADFVMFSGRNILFFFAHLNKRIRLIKTVGSGAVIHHLACAFYLQERKNYVFCTFQLAPNFRAVSDPLPSLQYGKKLIFTIFGSSCFLLWNSASLGKTQVWMRLDMEMSSAADQQFLLMLWNLTAWRTGHIPQRNKHSHIQSPTHKTRLVHILFS